MNSTFLRRSSTVLSAVAIAALLGTPALAGGQGGSATDKSGASANASGTFQGKSTSTPDQDGTGTDRGADNNDKTGPGTDGNNGCGNEPRAAAPRDGGRPTDDDNNGWCGSKPKPTHSPRPARPAKAAPSAKPTKATQPAKPAKATQPAKPAKATQPAKPAKATQPAKPAKAAHASPTALPTPAAQPNIAAVNNSTRHGSVADTAVDVPVAVAGVRMSRQVVPAAVAGVKLTAPRPAPSVLDQAALPYTGSSAQTLMILGVVLLAGGLVVTEMGRSSGATG